MVDIKISGRKVTVSDALRSHVEEKIGDVLKVFDIQPMTCDVVLRVDKNPSNLERKSVEVTVFVRNSVVRVVSSGDDMYGAIDEAAASIRRALSINTIMPKIRADVRCLKKSWPTSLKRRLKILTTSLYVRSTLICCL